MSFIRTVLGDIAPDALGRCYAHEHLIIDRSYTTLFRSAGEDHDLGRVRVDGGDEEPSEVRRPDRELVEAEAVAPRGAVHDGGEVDRSRREVGQDRRDAARQAVAHLLGEGGGAAEHLGGAPRAGQAEPAARLEHHVGRLRAELEVGVAEDFAEIGRAHV